MGPPQETVHLVTLGDLVADLVAPIPQLPIVAGQHQRLDWLRMEAGGTSNTQIMAARLGLKTVVVGALGNDYAGRHVTSILDRENVSLEGMVVVDDQTTPIAIVFVDQQGNHVFVGAMDSAEPIPFQDCWYAILQKAEALFTTGYAMNPDALFGPANNLQCMQIARDSGCRVFMDLGPITYLREPDRVKESFPLVHVILATAEEIGEWTGYSDPVEGARQLRSAGPDLVVIKTGADGCIITSAEKEIVCPGFQVEFRDSAGAGDAFAAGFIAAVLANADEYTAGLIANAVGAATVTHLGTGSLLPSRSEVTELLASADLPMLPWT